MTITVRAALALTSAAGLLAALPAAPAHAAVPEIQLASTLPAPVAAGAVTLRRTTPAPAAGTLRGDLAVAPDGTVLQWDAAATRPGPGGVPLMQPRRITLLNPVTGAVTVIRPATGTARDARLGAVTAGWAVWVEGGGPLAGDGAETVVLAYNRTTRTTTVLRRLTRPLGNGVLGGLVVSGGRAWWNEWVAARGAPSIVSRALTGAGALRQDVARAATVTVDQCAPATAPAVVYGVWSSVDPAVPDHVLRIHRRVVGGAQAGTDTVISTVTITDTVNFGEVVACGPAVAFQRDQLTVNPLGVRWLVRLVADGRTVDLALPSGFQGRDLTLTARALGLGSQGLGFPGGQYLYHRARQAAFSFGTVPVGPELQLPQVRVRLSGTAVTWRSTSGSALLTSVGTIA